MTKKMLQSKQERFEKKEKLYLKRLEMLREDKMKIHNEKMLYRQAKLKSLNEIKDLISEKFK